MNLYQAIDEMRRLSRAGQPFSFSYMSYSLARRTSDGIVTVPRARLLAANRREHNRYTDYMLLYEDLDTRRRARCWQPLLLTFNDQELELT